MEGTKTNPALLAVACLALIAMPARAVDGVLEIHQACVATGCFPGDGPGFPVEIAEPGSYRLTSNLQVPDEDTTGIEVTVELVTIDLNGFAIRGVTQCSVTECSPAGDGTGIDGSSGHSNVRVRNGSVESMGASGIHLAAGSSVEDVHAASNGGTGIVAERIVDSVSLANGGTGIGSDQNGATEGCIARLNHGDGIRSTGVVVNSASFSNSGSGIVSSLAGVIRGNVVADNDGLGLELGPTSGYADNTLISNNGGSSNPQVSGGIELGTNICGTDTNCP